MDTTATIDTARPVSERPLAERKLAIELRAVTEQRNAYRAQATAAIEALIELDHGDRAEEILAALA